MDGQQHRMLLVEDDPDTRNLLRRILTLCGWVVVEAGSIAEGLAWLDPPPDCVVLDLELPDGDGSLILKKIRDDGLMTRVVVNTGIVDAARLGKVADLHPDCLLRKPLDSAGLKSMSAM